MPDRLLMALVRLRLRLPRPRNLAIPLFGLLATLGALAPAATADDKTPYEPGGLLDMMPSPIKPPGQGTLYESYDPEVFKLDRQLKKDFISSDAGDKMGQWCADMLMAALRYVGRAAVVIVQWTFNVTTLPQIEQPISRAIGGAAGPMVTMFLPSALAVGAFLAWAKRSQASPLGQLAWVVASAAIATTFLTAPSTWVKGVDATRELGSSVAMTTISGGLSGSTDSAVPFKSPEPQWSGNAKNDTLRRASDAVWRTYVATPWCIADLGSLKACQKWGPEVVKRGTDMDDREDFLSHTLNKKTVGTAAVKWRQGHEPSGRFAVLLAALVSAIIFAALCITLAFTTLASLIGAMMLLVCGVVFACLWCIPGKPRQWGVSWFETLLGLVLVSFITTMLLGSEMIVSTALLSMLDPGSGIGWLMVSSLNIAAAAMAFRVKGKLDGIISVGGAQLAGRGALSYLNTRRQSRRLRKALGGKNKRSRKDGFGDMDRHEPKDTTGEESTDGGRGAAWANRRSQRARNFPPPPTWTVERDEAAPSDYASIRPGLAAGQLPPSDGPDTGPDAPRGAGPGPAGPPHDPAAARRTKADRAQRRAGTPYPVRPGAPSPVGPGAIPPSTAAGAGRVIPGTVVTSDKSAGSRFRDYPPPASRSGPRDGASAAGQAAARAAARATVNTALTANPNAAPAAGAVLELPPGPTGG